MRNLVLIIIGLLFTCNVVSQTNKLPLGEWVRKTAIIIESPELQYDIGNIEPFSKLIGDAKVVCLGESRHDIHEQFVLKHRLIEYLIEEMGFRVFILEASLPYAEKINDYISGHNEDIDEIMSDMPGWFIWDTEEMKDIIVWMKKYNEKQKENNKIQFFGIDIVAPVYGLNKVTNYLKNVDPDYYSSLHINDFAENDFYDNFWPKSMQTFALFSPEKKKILRDNYSNLLELLGTNKARYINNSSKQEYDLIQRYAYCAQQANEMFSAEKRLDKGLIRDSAMANNTLWILNNKVKNNKAIIWAHNVHIAKAEFEMTGETESIKGMGYILSQELGSDLISIGATFDEGEYTEWSRTFAPANNKTIEGIFAGLGHEYFILDIRNNNFEVLNTTQVIRGQDFEMTTIPSSSFDALYFTKTITRVTPCEVSLEKYRNMK